MDDEEEDEPLPLVLPSSLPTATQSTSSAPLFSLNLDQVEEEDEDMPLLPVLPADIEAELPISQDFIDAQRSIDENVYDIGAWKVYIEEVNRRKSGSVSVPEAYLKLLNTFPRSAKHWIELIRYYMENSFMEEAEKSFQLANLQKCRSVDLWLLYIDFLKSSTFDKKRVEEAFEESLRNVGLAIDSGPLWRKYLDYISEIRDPTRLHSLRRVYQRVLCVPLDSLDLLWSEYDKLERSAGEHLADQLLPEFQEKCNRAKAAYKDRKRLIAACDMHRLATPPKSAAAESQQLDAWNKLFK